ncbi:hypothetical protein GCM10009647_066250 [Streptomyces sanglieri]|uniref:hypothetical protein n=1 Tax=Streptomyces sp. Wh19 TaxID=3076629 RepID=UPI002958BE0A|nr:hypothetical protein [Streptomyces sp. Wh19]MDV9195788.1 hypothetical protein [Streptomyces sp. Wh19]
MPCELIERMAACDDCRNLAVDYGMNLIGSRRHNADPRHWELPLTLTRVHLDEHLITAHAVWLPDRQPDCGICETWREEHTIGPIHEAEALHRTWHLCEQLREICTPGNHELTHLM